MDVTFIIRRRQSRFDKGIMKFLFMSIHEPDSGYTGHDRGFAVPGGEEIYWRGS